MAGALGGLVDTGRAGSALVDNVGKVLETVALFTVLR